MLGGGRVEGEVQRGGAPHALGTIALDDLGHALAAIHLALATIASSIAVCAGFLPCHRAIVAVLRGLASFVGCWGPHGGREKAIWAVA